MQDKKYAYIYDKPNRQITVGTAAWIESLNTKQCNNINYCSSEEELAVKVRKYYKQEFIVTLTTRLNTFERHLFL
ncbi:hypothetical protein D7Z54_19820 [Salibacterium salarium]|uniref:Uncharacterized protein n=1 Tax=Salibacterium salarium TaxID=284579 RepID=A0A3R9QJA0_9BACI|nr:hypothetical protein [Salibacterium salarium]RSL31688.1 hypothetical protein D7Z54_19820 [Salibacterium salarium]